VTRDEIVKILPESCDENSDKWLNVGPEKWGGDPSYLDHFFLRPADPTKYKP
jgi:ribose transport system substrate-binding protein